jgi:Tol biopolymer transport system component
MSKAEPPQPDPLVSAAERVAGAEGVDWVALSRDLDDPGLQSRCQQLRQLDRLSMAFRGATHADAAGLQAEGVLFRWGELEVLEEIGAGSFGQVYRARDPVLDRQVALKLRPAGPSRPQRGGRRYLDEARRLARLRHPNVLPVHGAAEHDGRVGFWTDLIQGRNLAEVVADTGPLGPAEAAAIGRTLCGALAAVHAAGLVHGDVKPSNVMRERGGRIVLLDFGAASLLGEGATTAVAAQGTPAVLAPELLDGAPPDAASDLYALGTVLYFLVTGTYPVSAASLMALRECHRRGELVPLRDRRADLPAGFVAVVERALAARPQDRYASAGEMERALRELDPGRMSSPKAWPRWPAVGFTALALAGIAVFAAWRVLTMPAVQGVPAAEPYRLQDTAQVVDEPGHHGQPAFSPDGRMMAYVTDRSGSPQLWIRSLAGGESFPVTRDGPPVSRPRWSAADQIVFARHGDGIWTVAPLGGEPRRIVARGFNPDVSPDGTWLVFEHDRKLWRVQADGAGLQPIESVPQRMFEGVFASPAISPDGQRVAYFMQETGPLGDLWVVPLESGEPVRLTHDRVEAGDPAWTPDGQWILFWSRRGGSRNLWQVPAAGGTPVPLTSGAGEDGAPAVAPDGGRLLFTNTRNRWVLTVLDPGGGEPREILERRDPIWLPEAGPDGQIAFFFPRARGYHVFTLASDGTRLAQVTDGEERWNLHPRWSADGQWLYYYEERPELAFRRVAAEGGSSELIAAGWTWQSHMHAVPDPEQRRIAFLDQDAASGTTVILDLATQSRWPLPDPHLHGLEWSPDGRLVMGFTHGDELRLCAADGAQCSVLTTGLRPRFSPDGAWIYFHRRTERTDTWELWRIRSDGSGEHRLGQTGPHHPLDPTFAVTSAGEIVYVRFARGTGELWSARLEGSE